jgi:benzoyl-CoA reductase/2-hydroxyglutaryl-CoA dehydratase subunit BcrC/BadD/HgdB
VGEVNEGVIQGVVQQMKNMALELARISGRPLDPAAFRETVSFSAQTSRLWREVLETAAHRPAPISFGDMCIHIGPAVVLRGLPAAVNYYRQLLSELRTRIREGRGAVPGELFRVYWEGMPIWGRLRWLAESLAEMGIAGVASTYGHSWIYDAFDPEDPFTSTARGYTALFTVRDESYKESFLKEMLSRFQVDGIIFHHSRTCPSCTNSLYGMPRRLTERTGIPHLLLDGDLNDLRCFSQEQALTNLEAFAELLAQRKTGQAA